MDGRVARCARPSEGVLGEVAQRQVDLDRPAGVREVTSARDGLELPVAEPGQRAAVTGRRDPVTITLNYQHRAVQVPRQLAQGAPVAVDLAICRGDQSLGIGIQRPFHTVLDALGRVRLREASRDEPLRKRWVVLSPVDRVHVSPPAVKGPAPLKGVGDGQWVQQQRPLRWGVGEHRSDKGGARDPLGGEPRQLQQILGAAGEAHHNRPLGVGCVHDGQTVTREFRGSVAPWVAAAIGATVPEAVHGQ